jgi:hypothetical protein
MALQPIDLQTLFVRLSEIGRDQSAEKNAILQGQEVTGREIAQRSRLRDSSVQETSDTGDGPEQVHDDDAAPQQKESEQQKKESGEKEPEPEVVRDPDLGRNIDISG